MSMFKNTDKLREELFGDRLSSAIETSFIWKNCQISYGTNNFEGAILHRPIKGTNIRTFPVAVIAQCSTLGKLHPDLQEYLIVDSTGGLFYMTHEDIHTYMELPRYFKNPIELMKDYLEYCDDMYKQISHLSAFNDSDGT